MIGNQPSTTQVNQTISALALQMRTNMRQIRDFFTWVNSQGEAGLETLGFVQADADAITAQASTLNTLAGVYFGTATQAAPFDFDNELAPLWGGSVT